MIRILKQKKNKKHKTLYPFQRIFLKIDLKNDENASIPLSCEKKRNTHTHNKFYLLN